MGVEYIVVVEMWVEGVKVLWDFVESGGFEFVVCRGRKGECVEDCGGEDVFVGMWEKGVMMWGWGCCWGVEGSEREVMGEKGRGVR